MPAKKRPEKPKIFVSHIADESKLADIFQRYLSNDFLEILEIFVSSDESSISAGTNWLNTIDRVLKAAKLEIVLCSRASVGRPWINFEAGAGWIRGIPIVPVCHSGLRTNELPMPLNALESIEASQRRGLQKLYNLIAEAIGSKVPSFDSEKILAEIKEFELEYSLHFLPLPKDEDKRKSNALDRMRDALKEGGYRLRTIERLAIIGGISETEAMDILRIDTDIIFTKTNKGQRAAKLRKR